MKKEDLKKIIKEELDATLNEKNFAKSRYATTIAKMLDDEQFYSLFEENLIDITRIVHENIDDLVEQHAYYGLSRESLDAVSKYLTHKVLNRLIKLNKETSFETEYSKEYDNTGKHSVK